MVGGSDFHLKWLVNNYSSPRPGNNDRCITAGLGSSLPRGSHEGTLVSAGIKHPSYQCIGAESSIVCCENFHCQRKAVACPPENGQQDRSGLCIENGGDTILGIGRDSPGIMGLCSDQTNYTDSRISSWKIQSRGRLGVQALPGLEQLETESQHIPGTRPTLGAPRDRPVCRPSQCSTDELCQLVSRPICPGNRCLSDSLVETERLQLSTFLNDLRLSGKDQERPGNNSYDNTNLAYTSMVPSSTRNVLQTASSAPPSRENPYVSQSTATPPCSTRKLTTRGLDGFRQNILAKGVSEQTAELLSSHSWRKGTTRAYNSAWSQWCGWCHQREIDPFCSTVTSIADYLTEMFNKGRCYRTINNHRSAISAFHKPIEGCKAGQHELVCKVLNACFNARPPQPRYVVMWGVDRVLDYICTLGCDANLSDKQLTLKLSMLLALASAGRSSDLRALDLRYMTVKESCIVFELGRLTKCRKKGQCPLKLTFTAFDTNPDLCAVSTINCYLERTKGWRSDCNKNQLLLGYIKPHKEVVPCTIAGWLVQMMKESGLDTSEFRAHSTRGASTSKAKAKGFSCQEIMNMAKWKKESTFRRHYLRDIVSEGTGQDAFQATVLQEG